MTALDERTTTTPWGLTAEQVELLLRMIAEGRVRQQKGNDHLEAWDIRRWLNRIFGFTGWSEECLSEVLVHERIWPAKEEGKFRCTAVYRVRLRLHIRDVWGNELKFSDGAAAGESVNQPSIGDAHDMALKTAYSQALKRCAIDLGDQFGLSLYSKTRRQDDKAVVQQTLGHPFAPKASDWNVEVPEDAPVTSGELDEQRAEHQDEPSVREPKPARPRSAQRSKPQQPTEDEWTQPAPGAPAEQPMISDGQRKAIFALLKQKHPDMADEERYSRLSRFAGRQVTSLNQYTYEEASRLLKTLSPPVAEPEAPPVPYDAGAAVSEAHRVNRLRADLLAEVAAADLGALDAILSRATELRDAGSLPDHAWQAVAAAVDERGDVLVEQRDGAAAGGWSHRALAQQTGVDLRTGVAA